MQKKLTPGVNSFILVFVGAALLGCANPHQLSLTRSLAQYRREATIDSLKLVTLQILVPGIQYQPVYATTQNFTGRILYRKGTPIAVVRKAAAIRLVQAANALQPLGYGIYVYDAYRPYQATRRMWRIVPDDRYAANPKNGSGHNRGIAIDLTLYELASGKLLAMPTGFDNFTDTAHHGFTALPAEVLANRQLLRSTMESAGFRALETEWWHYSLPNGPAYPLLDLNFKKLNRLLPTAKSSPQAP